MQRFEGGLNYDPGRDEEGSLEGAIGSMTEGLLEGRDAEFLCQLTEVVRTESSDGARLVSPGMTFRSFDTLDEARVWLHGVG